MDPKGYEKKPWFPYLKNMYDEIEGDMMEVDAKGYEEKPWWPYVLDLQEKTDAGGGGGSSDFSTAEVTFVGTSSIEEVTVYCAFLEEAAPPFVPEAESFAINSFYPDETSKASVILYKGRAKLIYSGASTATATGDISISGTNITIRGNGTITFA